jgi:hypothetical protein
MTDERLADAQATIAERERDCANKAETARPIAGAGAAARARVAVFLASCGARG